MMSLAPVSLSFRGFVHTARLALAFVILLVMLPFLSACGTAEQNRETLRMTTRAVHYVCTGLEAILPAAEVLVDADGHVTPVEKTRRWVAGRRRQCVAVPDAR